MDHTTENQSTLPYSTEAIEVVHKALAQSDKPKSLSDLRKDLTGPFKLDKTALETLVGDQQNEGKIFDWSTTAKTKLYWHINPKDQAIPRILEFLQTPKTMQALTKDIKNAMPLFPARQIPVIVRELIDSGRVFLHPKKGKTEIIGVQPPPPPPPPPPEPKAEIIRELSEGPRQVKVLFDALNSIHPLSKKAFDKARKELVAEQRVFELRDGQLSLTPPPPVPESKTEIIRELGQGPRQVKVLFDALNSIHPLSKKAFDKARKELVAEHRVFELPDKNLSLTPPDPRQFMSRLKSEFETVRKKTSSLGITDEQLLTATAELLGIQALKYSSESAMPDSATAQPEPDLSQRLLKMIELADYQALISIRDLRRFVDKPKEEFDAAILRLQNEQKVTLHSHDHPAGLNDDEKHDLVADDQGRYFVGIALKKIWRR